MEEILWEKADVINMSLGGVGTSQLYEEAIGEAVSGGSVVVVAAGNDSEDANDYTPANFKSAITAQPEFSKASGSYTTTFAITISCREEDAEIYYTLDGTMPTRDNGILYVTGTSVIAS